MTAILYFIFIGDTNIGCKTAFINTYINSYPTIDYVTTIGINISTKKFIFEDRKEYNMIFFDTAGQERFLDITKMQLRTYFKYPNKCCIFMGFDLTKKQSFLNLDKIWNPLIYNIYGENHPPIYLICGKSDIEKDPIFSNEYLNYYCVSRNYQKWWKVSCKDMININEPIDYAINDLLLKKLTMKDPNLLNKTDINQTNNIVEINIFVKIFNELLYYFNYFKFN